MSLRQRAVFPEEDVFTLNAIDLNAKACEQDTLYMDLLVLQRVRQENLK